nr:hypothetical protein [Nocardia aurea]
MPSRAEGFGLVGLEAIVAGTLVLVSKSSGLGMLPNEVLPKTLAGQVTVPVTDDPDKDRIRWGHAIASVLGHPDAAFATAQTIRKAMATSRTWSAAAEQLLTVAAARL